MPPSFNRFWLVPLIITSALVLTIWQPIELTTALAWGAWLTAHPLALVAVIGLMILMFTFAMPASIFVWLIGCP